MHLLSKGCLNTKEEDAINLHRMLRGKIEIHNRVSVENAFDEESCQRRGGNCAPGQRSWK
jgi:hypothetical protein